MSVCGRAGTDLSLSAQMTPPHAAEGSKIKPQYNNIDIVIYFIILCLRSIEDLNNMTLYKKNATNSTEYN